MREIKVLYHEKDMEKLEFIGGYGHSVAVDLYTAEDVEIEAGEFKLISLGVTLDIPTGYKVDIRPRSSTFSKYGLIQTNHVGLVDSQYSGLQDLIKMPVFSILTQNDVIEAFKQYSKNTIEAYNLPDDCTEEDYNKKLHDFKFRKTFIPKGTRICQMEIMPIMEEFKFVEGDKENWKSDSRGGFGSTGSK